MRLHAVAALLLLSPAAAAQPADTTLAREIVEAIAIADIAGGPLALSLQLDQSAGDRIGVRIAREARARLAREFSADELVEIRSHARGPAATALTSRARELAPKIWDPAFVAELTRRVFENDSDGLADSALTAAYVASLADDEADAMLPEVMASLNRLDPSLAAELKQVGFYDVMRQEMNAPSPPLAVKAEFIGNRMAITGVDEALVRDAIRFNTSPLGVRFQEAAERAVYRGFAPDVARSIINGFNAPPPPPAEVFEIEPADPSSGPPPPAAAGDEIYEVVEQNPVLIGGMASLQGRVEYPRLAREAGIEGRVFVQFVVDETGTVVDPVVVRSPSELLSDAALRAVRETRFEPGRQRGRPVKVRFSLPINFVLNDIDIIEVPDLPAYVLGGTDALQNALVAPEGAPSGTVFVRVVLDPTGTVTGVRVERSPHPSMEQPALDAVLAVEYAPAEHRGVPVHTALMVPVRFEAAGARDKDAKRR